MRAGPFAAGAFLVAAIAFPLSIVVLNAQEDAEHRTIYQDQLIRCVQASNEVRCYMYECWTGESSAGCGQGRMSCVFDPLRVRAIPYGCWTADEPGACGFLRPPGFPDRRCA